MAKALVRGADDLNMNRAYVEKPSLWWFGNSTMSETRMWNAPKQAIDCVSQDSGVRRETIQIQDRMRPCVPNAFAQRR